MVSQPGPEGPTTSDTEVPTEAHYEMNVSRRRFVAMTGAAAVAVASGAGSAAAAEDQPNFSSDLVQSPRLETTATIEEHTADMSTPLGYINDNGETVSLANDGGVVASREDSDTPHNPLTLRADKLAAGELRQFPRNLKYDSDGDGDVDEDDDDVRAVDATHWTKDTSGVGTTGASMTVETVTAANSEDALRVVTDSFGSGDVGLATFDLSTVGSEDATITSGVDRKVAQLVANVDALASGAIGEVRIKDSSGNVITLVIDSAADSGAITTIATATGKAQLYQEQIGEFTTSLNDIQVVEIAVKDADLDLVLPGINFDKEAEWEFGSREFTNADDELETETVTHPSGTFSITSLDSLPSVWVDGGIWDLQVDVEFRTEELEASMRRYRWPDADRYDYPNRLETLVGLEPPTAYALSYTGTTLRDEVLFPGSRYLSTEFTTSESELPEWSDVDDGNVSWTDKSSTYDNATVDDDVTLSSSISSGALVVVHFDVQMSDDEKDSATASSGGAGGGPTSSSSGLFSGVRGIAMSVLVGVLGWFGWNMRGS